MFRLLALHPGPDVSVPGAAGLAAVGRPAAEAALTELAAMNMAAESGPRRFALHSLLKEFALERAADEESEAGLEAARQRMFDTYLHTAVNANVTLTTQPTPARPAPECPVPGADVTTFRPNDSTAGIKWFATEREVLGTLVTAAAAQRRDLVVWQLVCTQSPYLGIQARWEEDLEFGRLALRSARALGDPLAEAHLHRLLGRCLANIGDTGGSLAHLERALRAYEAAGHPIHAVETHRTIANVWYVAGDHEAACTEMAVYLEYSRASGNGRAEAMALNSMGWFHAHLGRYDSALELLREALDLLHTSGDDTYLAKIWDSLGFTYHRSGDLGQAVSAYSAAIAASEAKGDERQRGLEYLRIGDVYRDAGDLVQAERHWAVALQVMCEWRWPEAQEVRERLAGVDLGRSVV
jgi:tetratricopeptide (TPR) repeat protein